MASAAGALTVSTRAVESVGGWWSGAFWRLVVLVFVGVFGHHVRVVQGQGERASVLSALGALRTGVDSRTFAKSTHIAQPAHSAPPNPFLTLDAPPSNYAGEKSVLASLDAPPGSWAQPPVRLYWLFASEFAVA